VILCDCADTSLPAIQEVVTFAGLLAAAGHDTCIDSAALPAEMPANFRYEALPYLRDISETPLNGLIVLRANSTADSHLARWRRLDLPEDALISIFGSFPSLQSRIATKNRYAFALGRSPHVTDLSEIEPIVAGKSGCPCIGVAAETPAPATLADTTPVLFFAPKIRPALANSLLQMVDIASPLTPIVLTSGQEKTDWLKSRGPDANIFGYSDFAPTTLAGFGRLLVLTAPIEANYRMLCLANSLLLNGGTIIDATAKGLDPELGLPVLRGPADPQFLAAYLRETVLPNLDGIAADAEAKRYTDAASIAAIAHALPPLPARRSLPETRPPRLVFMPTNGVGLGHAQRCTLIADALPDAAPKPHFAAFPSCLQMIRQRGFDATPLVQRTHQHSDKSANDLLNATRLGALTQPGDTFVFDGGFIFPSVMRTIIDKGLSAVWIRRGLWSNAQNNLFTLDREKVFSRVIVPREAFDGLNQRYSSGNHVHETGPVVQILPAGTRDKTRAALQQRYGLAFDKLVVTMPGGGVAADLSAHVQATASAIEARGDTLNLIVAWPGAQVHPAWFGWTRTRVVTTLHAGLLAQAADLMVSAAGYNSFHEALYNRIPALFIPQVASYMDNQTARAEMAADLGLARYVPANKPGAIDGELTRCLDHGLAETLQQALATHDLPAPGNGDAARIIAELAQ